ncbi:MAG: hypothetical protein NZ703_01665 [Gemmataceae bacterium]|nr:hypothetical protein [Gemmataceae bacterium]MCS7269765.1 hypothetical protein [Gemmataceae bacterium]MDW8243590.1 hypothetical protein [Thermogemmata sp.]
MNPYASWCDEFGVTVYVHSRLDMPTNRETILHFFEAVHKGQPSLTDFDKRGEDEYFLEEDRESGTYRWVSLDRRRLSCGYVNPPTLESADEHIHRILELAPYYLDLSSLATDSMDVMYYFDLIYQGNHDQLVMEALSGGTPLESFGQLAGVRVLHYQPTITLALDESFQLQARLSVETRSSIYHLRTGQTPPESPISIYLTVRQFWHRQPPASFVEAYQQQRRLLEELVQGHVLPQVLQPLARAIRAQ